MNSSEVSVNDDSLQSVDLSIATANNTAASIIAVSQSHNDRDQNHQSAVDHSISSSPPVDDSCTTESLLKYYDDCAEYYDHTDEGSEDTYVCVDRVMESIIRYYDQLRIDVSDINDIAHAAQTLSIKLDPVVSPQPTTSCGLHAESPTRIDSPTSTSRVSSITSTDDLSSSLSSTLPSPSPSPSPTSVDFSLPSFNSSPLSLRIALAPSSTPLKILDLGVGTGLASRPLFANLSSPLLVVPRRSAAGEEKLHIPDGCIIPEIWGVDLSPNMLKVSSVLPFKHLIVGDINTSLFDVELYPESPLPPLPTGFFDIVVSVGTTEFVRDFDFFFHQVCHFLRIGGIMCATFPSNRTVTYPTMACIQVDELKKLAEQHELRVMEIQHYRGWSVSAEEHVEYTQLLAIKAK